MRPPGRPTQITTTNEPCNQLGPAPMEPGAGRVTTYLERRHAAVTTAQVGRAVFPAVSGRTMRGDAVDQAYVRPLIVRVVDLPQLTLTCLGCRGRGCIGRWRVGSR